MQERVYHMIDTRWGQTPSDHEDRDFHEAEDASVTGPCGNAKRKIQVTIGVCVKNSEKTIRHAIEGIINQEYPSELMEVIVVDGGSKDRTLPILTSILSKAGKHVQIYFDQGRGLGTARQIVVDNCHAPYIIWVDGDVVLLKDSVKRHVEFMEENPRVGVALGEYVNVGETLVASLQSLRKHAKYRRSALRNLPPPDPTTNGAIYRVEAVRQVGGFDQKIAGAGEDLDLTTRILQNGWLFCLNERMKFYHFFKDTWSSLWLEQVWFGYGERYLRHKHKGLVRLWSKPPPISFLDGLRTASDAYKLTCEKKSFLLPLLFVFQNMGVWYGFARGYLHQYGD